MNVHVCAHPKFVLLVPECQRSFEVELRPARGLVDGAKLESDYPIDKNKKIRFFNRIAKRHLSV